MQFLAPTSEESTVSSFDVGSILALAFRPESRSKFLGSSGTQILGQKARWPRQRGRPPAGMANVRLQMRCALAHFVLNQAPAIWTRLLAGLISGSVLPLPPASRKQAAHVVQIRFGRASAHLNRACCLRVRVCFVRECGPARCTAAAALKMTPCCCSAPWRKHRQLFTRMLQQAFQAAGLQVEIGFHCRRRTPGHNKQSSPGSVGRVVCCSCSRSCFRHVRQHVQNVLAHSSQFFGGNASSIGEAIVHSAPHARMRHE